MTKKIKNIVIAKIVVGLILLMNFIRTNQFYTRLDLTSGQSLHT